MTARNRFLLSILAVLAVFVVGTTGYLVIEGDQGITFRDAAYMTVITLSTVGYSEPWELSQTGQLWTIAVITFGIVTVSYALGSLVSVVISGELGSLREQNKMEKKIEQSRNHVVLCGFGRMGSLAADELLSRGTEIVVIESDPKYIRLLQDSGVLFVEGDATEEDNLMRAGLMRASAVVIALPSDANNVFITLTVRAFRPDLTVVARAEQPSTEPKLKRAGATRVVCPQATGAMHVANILTRPTVVDFVELASKGVDLEIDEYVIEKSSPLVGKSLRQSNIRSHTNATAVAIKRVDGATIVNPDPDAELASGDTLILVGSGGASSRLDQIEEHV